MASNSSFAVPGSGPAAAKSLMPAIRASAPMRYSRAVMNFSTRRRSYMRVSSIGVRRGGAPDEDQVAAPMQAGPRLVRDGDRLRERRRVNRGQLLVRRQVDERQIARQCPRLVRASEQDIVRECDAAAARDVFRRDERAA